MSTRAGPPIDDGDQEAQGAAGYIAQLEGGLRKNPSLPALRKLALALGVPVAELLE